MAGESVGLRAAVKPLKEAIVERSERGLSILFGAIGSVLLIACLNLAILNLVRAERRSLDSAVRIALGQAASTAPPGPGRSTASGSFGHALWTGGRRNGIGHPDCPLAGGYTPAG